MVDFITILLKKVKKEYLKSNKLFGKKSYKIEIFTLGSNIGGVNVDRSLSGLNSLNGIGLHRVIKVLCVFLALLTYLLLYVIGNAIIAPTSIHVVIQRPKNGLSAGKAGGQFFIGLIDISKTCQIEYFSMCNLVYRSLFQAHLKWILL